ncbi:hypothetical protein MMC07_006223 [Pseudocyphellaria aurata]|nr:hypothetical protein [Pseudocyphellaria aurata]
MDPFGILGVAASIITCVQLTGALLKRVGPSDHSRKDLNEILKAICGFRGAYENLKISLELNEQDEARLSALQSLEEPLRDCKWVLDLLAKRLKDTTLVGQYVVGTLWDAKLKKGLKRLQDAKTLFEMAMDADQHTILRAIERYVRNVGEDVRDLAALMNENGKRLRDLDEHNRVQSEKVNEWHAGVETAVHVIGENVLSHDKYAKKRHKSIEETLGRIGHDVTDHRLEWNSEAKQREKGKKSLTYKIVRWLSQTDPSTNHNAARDSHEPQTGDWFLSGEEYSHWKKTPQSFLWIHGIAGCGKTVLSSLLAQLVKKLPSIPCTLSKLFDQYRVGALPMDAIKVEFQSIVKHSEQTFIVIDGLDECPIGDIEKSRGKVLALLTELSGWNLPSLHVLVTSRREHDIDHALEPLVTRPPISIQTRQVQSDIHKYIKSQLANDLDLKRWPSAIKEEIEIALTERACGMFRWAFCQVDSLKRCIGPKDIREALKSLPETLDDFYARTLQDIDKNHHQIAFKALRWLVFSKRPLRIEELAEAMVVEPRATPAFDPTERLFDPHDLLKVLSSLVTVHREYIRLAHFSVEEYLLSNRPKPDDLSRFSMSAITADQLIAESCLLYMKCFAELEENCSIKPKLVEFPLMEYACRHWRDHVREAHFESSKAFSDLVFDLFKSKSRSQARLLIFNSENPAYDTFGFRSEWVISCASGPEFLFHNACCLNLAHTVQQLLELEDFVLVQSGDFGNTLTEISARGYETIVNRLIKAGYDVNICPENCGTALYAAAANGRETIVDRLLDAGADVNESSGYYSTPLIAAASMGYETIVDRLLDAGADVNESSGCYDTPLTAAAEMGYETIVDRLLDAGADVNISSGEYGTALLGAVVKGHGTIVNRLLDAGADVIISSSDYDTLLIAAASMGYETIVDRLLDAEADVNISSGMYSTALQAAAENGHGTIVKKLIKAGADVNISSSDYDTPLIAAASMGYETIVDRLLDARADVNMSSDKGTALKVAAMWGHEMIVEKLLDAGADVKMPSGYDDKTALQAAREVREETIVDRLLDAAAEVELCPGRDDTALQAAAETEHATIEDRLLDAGADVNMSSESDDSISENADRQGSMRRPGS